MTLDNTMTLGHWMNQLTLEPIDVYGETKNLYQPLEHAGQGSVDMIKSQIRLALRHTTTQLLSGPTGSGKTTELLRLRGLLQEQGYTVVLIDMLDYLDRSRPVDITELLIAIALGCSDGLGRGDKTDNRFLDRIMELLRRVHVSVDVPWFKAEKSDDRIAASVLGNGIVIDFRKELKNSSSFVDELRHRLAPQVGQLYDAVTIHIQNLVAAARAHGDGPHGTVVVVDSLDKVLGTASSDQEMLASTERLFVHNHDRLRFASHHMIYTVPPYLTFTDPGMLNYDGPIRQVPVPWVRNRQGERDTESEHTISELAKAVERRIPWPSLLCDRRLLEEIILLSGGHLRALWMMLRELIAWVGANDSELPIDHLIVGKVLTKFSRSFATMTREDADFLREVIRHDGILEPPRGGLPTLARLMHTQIVLAHADGEIWYEVHPLAERRLAMR